jgi:hypothetical protein
MKPVTDVLREYRKGQLADEATEELAKVVKAVMETGQAGTLTLILTAKPHKGDASIIILAGEVKSKVPREALPDAIFYADEQGNLHRQDPKQRDMDTLFRDTAERHTAEG